MQLIAYFTATERRAWRWAGGALREEARFTAGEGGLAEWRDWLGRRKGAELTIVADLPGEAFHEETIPQLRGRDRAALIQRRLAQRCGDARLAAVLSLGPGTGPRREERLLLAAIGDAAAFEPWLGALRPACVRLAAFTSTALVTADLVARGLGRPAHGLFISVHASGLRECQFEQGRLRFSRFETTGIWNGPQCAARIGSEIDRLAAYLATRRAGAAQDRIPVTVIAPEAWRGALEAAIATDSRYALCVEPQERLGRRIGLRPWPVGTGAEALFLAHAARWAPSAQFARDADREEYLRRRRERALLAWGAAAACGGFLVAAVQWRQAVEARDLAVHARLESKEAAARDARDVRARPDLPTSAQNLRLVATEMRRIAARVAEPEAALEHLSRALERCQRVELQSVAWELRPLDAADAAADRTPLQTLEITARVSGTAPTDVRATAVEIACFAAALQTDPGWRLERTRLPFDLSPHGTLSGGEPAAETRTSFTIAVAQVRP